MPTTNEALIAITKELKTIYNMVLDMYNYMPIVYEQSSSVNATSLESRYTINTYMRNIPSDALIYMVPKYTNTKDKSVLNIILGDGTIKRYLVYIESTDGKPILAQPNSIIANRTAIFRLAKGIVCNHIYSTGGTSTVTITEGILLINNPTHNTITATNLSVTNDVIFNKMPKVALNTLDDINNTSQGQELVLYSDYVDLYNRIVRLENKFVIGNRDFDDVKDSLTEGQIYMKVEDIE